MKVLVLVACLAAAAVAQVHHSGHAAAGHVSHYEKVVETSAQPDHLVHLQQPASLLVKSVQVPVSGFQQTAYVSGQPASYFKTVERIENPALLHGEIHKFEKIEGAHKVELPAVTAYSGGYEQSSFIQKQPALASLSGYKTVVAQPAITTYTKEVVSKPALAAFVSSTPAPLISTYSSSLPLATAYKQQSAYVAQPAVTTYKKEFVTPAVSTYSAFPAASAYKHESLFANQPAVTTYKKEYVTPAVSTYSAFPAASAYKQESTIYSAKPAVTSYSAFPAASAYKQSAYVAQPAVTTYKKEFVTPAVSTYSAFPAAYKQESTIYSAKPAVTSYSAFPAASAYKQESTIYSAKPAVSSYSAFPAASAYKHESLFAAQPAVSAFGSAFQKYGGSAMYPGNYQSAEGASSILKLYKDDIGTGIYQYGYATSNGINHDEEGKVLSSKSADGSSAVSGSYSYPGPDGVTYTVKYTADEHGFHAYGDHLPKLSAEAQHLIEESAKYGEQKDY